MSFDSKIFDSILKNYQDVDLRDRVYYYYNLLKKDINQAEYIISGEPTIVDYFTNDTEEEYIDQIYSQFNSLSILYRKPEEKFTKYIGMEDEDKKDEDKKEDDKKPKKKKPAKQAGGQKSGSHINDLKREMKERQDQIKKKDKKKSGI